MSRRRILAGMKVGGAVTPVGLFSYYYLDSDASDELGLNNGTPSNITFVAGKINNAASFNGTTSSIILGNSSEFSSTDISMCCFVKTASAGSSFRALLIKRDAWFLGFSNNILIVFDYDTASTRSTGIDITDDTWQHVVVTYKLGTTNGTKVYINGSLVLTTTCDVSGLATSSPYIGVNVTVQELAGIVDGVGYWDRELSASEALDVYNIQNGGNDLV